MKSVLLRLTPLLMLVAGEYAQTAAPPVTDLWAIQARLQVLKPKDTFETTAQYNARLASAFEVPSTLNVSVGDRGVSVHYDADTAVLTVALKTATVPRILNTLPEATSASAAFMHDNDPLHPESVLECESKLQSERTYSASNAYGKEVTVHELVRVTVGLALYGARWHIRQPDLTGVSAKEYIAALDRAKEVQLFRMNMDPATARETVPHLHLIVTGSPRNTPFLRGGFFKEAKIDDPTAIYVFTYLIPVDITQALLVDDRTSTIIATTAPQATATTVLGTPPSTDAPVDYAAKVGISFAEWLTLNSINLTELCRVNYGACKRLTKIQKSGKGDFSTQDQYGKTVAWSFKGGRVIAVR